MRLISVSAIDFDPEGSRIMRQDVKTAMDNRTGSRRVSRTATLDGGAEIYDTGYAAADRTIVVSTDLEHLPWLERMSRLYNTVRVATDEGAFIGVPQTTSARDNRAILRILITEEA